MSSSYNHPDCLIYADPPYLLSTRARKYYRQEMTDAEHIELLEVLERHTGPVLLSGYSHPLYEGRLAHWQRASIRTPTEHGNVRTEVLWLNARAARMKQLWLFPDPGREEQARVSS